MQAKQAGAGKQPLASSGAHAVPREHDDVVGALAAVVVGELLAGPVERQEWHAVRHDAHRRNGHPEDGRLVRVRCAELRGEEPLVEEDGGVALERDALAPDVEPRRELCGGGDKGGRGS